MPELAGRVGDAFEAVVREHEESWLSPLAVRSYETRGRERPEELCAVRTPFQRDRDRIVHSKPFRRLKGKTQVFIDPEGDHYRTRMTHTLETTAISRVVARALRLNEDLTEAIGLGHDMGHTPFGHAGEDALDTALGRHFGPDAWFRHHEHSYRIARHSGRAPLPRTLEGRIVRLVDRVAYINHDIDDALRAGVLSEEELPAEPIAVLGDTGSRRIDALVHDLVEHSEVAGDIVQGDAVGGAMDRLRTFMFDHVYLGPVARREHAKIDRVVRTLFEYYVAEPERIPDGGGSPDADLAQRVTDWLAGMTDRYCIRAFEALSVPEAFAL